MRKIVVDSAIPYVVGVFEPFVDEVVYLSGGEISARSVADAAALIVRTRTACNEKLLEGSSVKFIATATIGTDHIDLNYCLDRAIEVFSSAGCNARAVAQWVFAAIREMRASGTLGIVGVGNVGSEVCQMARERGVDVLLCDPPRAARQREQGGQEGEGIEGCEGFVELDYLLAHSDIVTVHVPLTDTTRGMVGADFLGRMASGAVLLNSSRGEVVEERALASFGGRFALDVWQGEPSINLELMSRAAIATPHVAGYSARGKARASEMCVRAVASFLGVEELEGWSAKGDFALEDPAHYDIMIDDNALRASPSSFESLRRIRL